MDEQSDVVPIRPPMPSRAEFELLVQQANAGDAKAVRDLRCLLDAHAEIWNRIGNLSAVAGTSMLRMASGGNRLISGSIVRFVGKLRKELLGPAPTRVERLSIERVLLTWLQMHHADAMVSSLQNVSAGTLSMWLRRQAQASRQFDAAVKSLATLRKLLPAGGTLAAGRSRRA